MDPLEPQEMKVKNINFCPKGTHIQMKSFSPKEISCFFKYPLLVAFRNVKGRLGEMPWKITDPAAISQYFPYEILLENNIITKAAII